LLREHRIPLAALAALFLLNLFVIWPYATTEHSRLLGSVEGSSIALVRHAVDHPGDFGWFPRWYNGMPYHEAAGLAVNSAAAAFAILTGASAASAFHIVMGLAYAFAPVALALWILRLGGGLSWAIAAGAVHSLFSPTVALFGLARSDVGGLFLNARLHNMLVYGENQHAAALALAPLVFLLANEAHERRNGLFSMAAAVVLAKVLLSDTYGALGCLLGLACWMLSLEAAALRRALPRLAATLALAFAIAAKWLPPSTLAHLGSNLAAATGSVWITGWLLLGLATLVVRHELMRRAAPRALTAASLLLLIAATLTASGYWFPSHALFYQPHRFQLEMELAFAAVAGAGLAWLWRKRLGQVWPILAGGALAALALLQAFHLQGRATDLAVPVQPTQTAEYRMAEWFGRNMKQQRVFAPGSTALWLNAWVDTPQLTGCCDLNVPDPIMLAAPYVLYNDEGNVDASLLWLKAYGVHAIGVTGPGSKQYHQLFRNPAKFDGRLQELWHDGPDRIYAIPQRSSSLAHIVHPGEIVTQRPYNGLAVDAVSRYVAALEDPSRPAAKMDWFSGTTTRIQAQLQPGDLLSVQVSYHPGWIARVNGADRSVRPDGLGLSVIEPRCDGDCTVEFLWTGGAEKRFMRLIQWAGILAAALWGLLGWRRLAQGKA
jgi:hypothetical protein